MIAQYALYLIGLVLVIAMLFELRSGKIPNWLTLVPFVVFIAVAVTVEDRSTLLWQLLLAVAVFAVGLLLFAFVGFGAGAVKLMSGLALFVPVSEALTATAVFVASVFLTGFVVIQARKFIGNEESNWHVLRGKSTPMSVPLAMACLGSFFVF